MSSMDYNNSNSEIHIDFDEPVNKGGKKISFVIFGKEYLMDAVIFRQVLDKGLCVSGRECDFIRTVTPAKK